MQSTITDWQGELRVGALVGGALQVALRHPILVLLGPTLAVGLAQSSELQAALLYSVPLAVLNPWTAALLRPQLWLATPVVALIWVFVARTTGSPAAGSRRRGWCVGTLAAFGTGLLVLTAADAVGGVALGLVALMATAVPAYACEPDRRGLGWRLMRGHRGRWLSAWALLQLGVAAALATAALSVSAVWPEVPTRPLAMMVVVLTPTQIIPALAVLHAGLALGLTIALSVTAYAALKRRHDLDDVDRWLEVFQ